MSQPEVRCAWCGQLLRAGIQPPSHGICRSCAATWDVPPTWWRRQVDRVERFLDRLGIPLRQRSVIQRKVRAWR
jgi:hypothetical protein